MILGNNTSVKVATHLITEFFPYREGPRMKSIACTITLDSSDISKLHREFEKHTKYTLENHVAWIQDNDLLYVYSDGRLLVGVADKTVKMWVQ